MKSITVIAKVRIDDVAEGIGDEELCRNLKRIVEIEWGGTVLEIGTEEDKILPKPAALRQVYEALAAADAISQARTSRKVTEADYHRLGQALVALKEAGLWELIQERALP